MNRVVRSLRTTSGILVPLVLALGGATAVALAPASSETFAVAAAPSENYVLARATFAPVSASGLVTAAETSRSASEPGAIAAQPDASTPEQTIAPQAVLTVRMSADREEARPGQKITYTVVVGNVGTGDASTVTAESHVPAGTTMGEGGCISSGGTATSPCFPVEGPGDGDSSAEHMSHTFGALRPGEVAVWRFTVTVNLDTPVNRVIKNHAHAQATDVALVTSDEVIVTVQ